MSPTSSEAMSNQLNRGENAHGSKHAERIKRSEEAAKAIIGEEKCALVGIESNTTMNGALIVDSGATSTLTSSFEKCTDLQGKVIEIQTAHGGTIMRTTHVGWKNFFARERLGRPRPITTRAYITPGLKNDLLSGMALNRAGYRVILVSDHEKKEYTQLRREGSIKQGHLLL